MGVHFPLVFSVLTVKIKLLLKVPRYIKTIFFPYLKFTYITYVILDLEGS